MDDQKVDKELERLRSEINIDKIDRVARVSKIMSLIIIPVIFGLFIYGTIRLNNLHSEIKEQESVKHAREIEIKAFQFEVAVLENKKMKLETELMNKYGLSIDSIQSLSTGKVLEHALMANDALKQIITAYRPVGNIEVHYFRKTMDEKRIVFELEALGYKFVAKPASEYMSVKMTNSMWFGRGVPVEDVKIVALAMLRAGVPLRGIRPYRNSLTNPNYKRNIIEVGASVDLEEKPLLTVEAISDARQFER